MGASRDRVGVGVDFGTSNSAVAVFDGERLATLPVDAGSPVMPSALYLDRDFQGLVGSAAIERYLRDNTGRVIEAGRETVGVIQVTVAGTDGTRGTADGGSITETFDVHAQTDLDLPGRLFRSVKRWLGHTGVESVKVFERRYRLTALLTPLLQHLFGAAPVERERLFLGRPVRFESRGAGGDRLAAARLRDAAGYAGVPDPSLYPEPVAAALSFARAGEADGTTLAFDFGAGTLDLTVLETRGARYRVLASHGVALGGDEIDRLICRARVFPELGEGSRVAVPFGEERREVPFRFERFADGILNWPLAYELNRKELREEIAQGMAAGGETRRRLARLRELVARNHAYRVFREIERAKVELSDAQVATLRVDELDLEIELTRADFERLLAPVLERVDAAVDRVMERAGLPDAAIERVVRTGGSACIPCVCALLESRFPGRVLLHEPFTSVAGGLAIASYFDHPASGSFERGNT